MKYPISRNHHHIKIQLLTSKSLLIKHRTQTCSLLELSPQGRELKCLVIAGKGEFTPEKAKKSGKAIVLIQNGIHSGEIEGKDACMLLLREMLITKEKFNLLKNVILLIIPVFNVDGHERLSPFNRPKSKWTVSDGLANNITKLKS